ncbi:MAG TPA: gfo/Idh/MocA family oxidoreductase, partial [Verrucomicrobia bacterium]|nr:gfo/Idh/MocA family oxidoreductase [Verrucomicrobiota bacterium]
MSKINRRRFLHHSFSAAAGVIAAPALLRSQSPNSKLGVAVVGVGGRGNSHLSAFVGDSRTEVRFIVDVDEKIGNDRCDQIEKKQGVRPRLVKDMRQALDSKDVDILSCATP